MGITSSIAAIALALAAVPAHPVLATEQSTSSSADDGFVAKGWGKVDQDEVPIEAAFRRQAHDKGKFDVHGILHAVRRVPGATIVYASQGFARNHNGWGQDDLIRGNLIEGIGAQPHWISLFDSPSGQYWFPLRLSEEPQCLCPTSNSSPLFVENMSGEQAGDEKDGLWTYAVAFPPLPDGVDTVDVSIAGDGKFVRSVPVGDGPLEPMAQPSGELQSKAFKYFQRYDNDGWPHIPEAGFFDKAIEPELPPLGTGDTEVPLHGQAIEYVTGGQSTADKKKTGDQSIYTVDADVAFQFDSADISQEAVAILDGIATELGGSTQKVTIHGHTDNKGSPEYNKELSLKRAEAVAQALKEKQPTLEFDVAGFGEERPVADNTNDEGRAANRRVEVTVG